MDDQLTQLYNVAGDGEAAMLDDLRRRAGQTWEHIGCWTNTTDDDACENCGKPRAEIDEGDLLP
jgi:hypothetical protein